MYKPYLYTLVFLLEQSSQLLVIIIISLDGVFQFEKCFLNISTADPSR